MSKQQSSLQASENLRAGKCAKRGGEKIEEKHTNCTLFYRTPSSRQRHGACGLRSARFRVHSVAGWCTVVWFSFRSNTHNLWPNREPDLAQEPSIQHTHSHRKHTRTGPNQTGISAAQQQQRIAFHNACMLARRGFSARRKPACSWWWWWWRRCCAFQIRILSRKYPRHRSDSDGLRAWSVWPRLLKTSVL